MVLGTRFLIPVLLPQIKDAFTLNNTLAGLAITVIWAGYAVMQFPAGILVDKFNARKVMSVSFGIAAGSLGLMSISPTFAPFFYRKRVVWDWNRSLWDCTRYCII
ncbi:MAG: sugar MFS transporter [Halobacteriaceae archaeon]